MIICATEFYRSSNGDCWTLMSMIDPVDTVVRHTPNRSSGGRTRDSTVAEFLNANGPGPEYAALRKLLEIAEKGPADCWMGPVLVANDDDVMQPSTGS